jgi:hypothetical protein
MVDQAERQDWLRSRLDVLRKENVGKDLSKPKRAGVVQEARNIAIALRMGQEDLAAALGLANRTVLTKALNCHALSWKLDVGTAASISQLVFRNATLHLANEELASMLDEKYREIEQFHRDVQRKLQARLASTRRARQLQNLELGS